MARHQKKRPAGTGRRIAQEIPLNAAAQNNATCANDASVAVADRQPALSGFFAGDSNGAILFRPSAGRPYALADARWFAAHPTRSHCFRVAANDERPAEYVLVRQVRPGVRLRIAVALDDATKAPALLHAADEVLHVAADLLLAQGCAAPDDVLREVEHRRACGGRG